MLQAEPSSNTDTGDYAHVDEGEPLASCSRDMRKVRNERKCIQTGLRSVSTRFFIARIVVGTLPLTVYYLLYASIAVCVHFMRAGEYSVLTA